MKRDILKRYTTLRNRLEKERAELRARLTGIEAALGGKLSVPLPAVEAEAPASPKRKISPAGKRAIVAAARARWAKVRAQKAGKTVTAPKVVAKPAAKPKKYFSPAARARLAAAAKARWTKAKATGKSRL